jgi:hypothetical protein
VPLELVNVVVEPSWFGVKYFPLRASGWSTAGPCSVT